MITDYFDQNYETLLEDYKTFLSFPSISSDPIHAKNVKDCANWLKNYVESIGFKTTLWETSSHPVLFAEFPSQEPNRPTLLLYNHYDVQPIDPIEKWETPPFSPTIKGNDMYARGAQDNKGQCFYVLTALKAFLETEKSFPINVKWIIEGDEEHGSQGLKELIPKIGPQLKADVLAVIDLGQGKKEVPAITLGIRGITTMQVTVTGSNIDLHSGGFGGVAYNPIHALVEILSSLRDSSGAITIPGFYDDVVAVDTSEISLDYDDERMKKTFDLSATGGEKKFSPWERAWIRPTLEINGICGGYTGDGFKTVIPGSAMAKISCRLVPNQSPEKIAHLVKEALEKRCPPGLSLRVDLYPGGGVAVQASPHSKGVKAFARAFKHVYNVPCEYLYTGGSIPVISELAKASGAEIVLTGLALDEDQIHAPNERFGLDRLKKGFLVIVNAIKQLGEG